ncbi:MAG: hypothetical protein HC915_13675 [Anaerolineae bacterium]|nr:hypothetical protein [Anaerolineae bacterium]
MRYAFEGSTGQLISASVESNFDAQLELIDPDGLALAFDDDSGGELQPLLEAIELPLEGTYILVVSGFGSTDGGPFSLTLVAEDGAIPATDSISIGETYSGDLTRGGEVRLSFPGETGQRVTISLSAEFDGLLDLLNPSGEVVASDDDSGEGVNPLLSQITLEENGEYTIVVSSFAGQGSGPFTLTLNPAEVAVEPTPAPVEPSAAALELPLGESIEATLGADGQARLTFEAAVGDVVSLGVAPVPFDAPLDLYLELLPPPGSR